MIKRIVFFVGMVLLLCCPARAKDFTYKGDGCTILYRFTPKTGTLNDLTVTSNGNFTFLPSNYGGITTFNLAGKTIHPWEEKHTSTLLREKDRGDTYEAVFRWSYKGKSFDFTITMQLNEKTLIVNTVTAAGNENVVEFGFDRSEHTPAPKIIYLPYGHNVLFTKGLFISGIIDPLVSNASAVIGLDEYYSGISAFFGNEAHYHTLNDGSRSSLNETLYITVSPDIGDTFFKVSNPVSPYRNFLVDKVIVDLWRGKFKHCRDVLETLGDLGMSDLFAIIHVWQKYGYDNGLPTTFPAGDAFGGGHALLEVAELCTKKDYLFALHTNYVDFYRNSDVWNSEDVALDSGGSWVKAWYNYDTGMQSYLMKPSRISYYAGLYEPQIHNAYRTTAAFLDVHSSVLPTYKVDFDAAVPDAGKQTSTFHAYKELLAYARQVHSGPVAGEGFGSSANIWAGYVDAMEADPRASHRMGGSDVPLIVDYKLQELHHLFVPHGAGYLERFFLDKWKDYTKNELERHRVTQIAYGNAGFIQDPFAKNIPIEEVLKDYCFLKHLQQYYLDETPEQVSYFVEGKLLTLSAALRKVLPTLNKNEVNAGLNEALAMLKVTYSGGFTIYVNRSKSRTFAVEKDWIVYRMPPNGFLAYKGDEFLAYTAVVDGVKRYYMYPKEAICCPVIAPVFVNVNGQRTANRSLLQVEYIDLLTWEVYRNDTSGIDAFRVYRVEDDERHLLAELAANTFSYRHRQVGEGKAATYALVAVTDNNWESDPVYITIR